jgi:hypothetical protein
MEFLVKEAWAGKENFLTEEFRHFPGSFLKIIDGMRT